MELKFLYSVSLEDYKKYVQHYTRKNNTYSVLGLLLGFFFFYEAYVLYLFDIKDIKMIAVHVFPVIIVAVFYVVFQLKLPNLKATYDGYADYINNVACIFTEDGIYSSYENGDYYFFRWQNLHDIECVDDIIIVSVNEQSAYIFNIHKTEKEVKDFILSKQKKKPIDAGEHLIN